MVLVQKSGVKITSTGLESPRDTTVLKSLRINGIDDTTELHITGITLGIALVDAFGVLRELQFRFVDLNNWEGGRYGWPRKGATPKS